MENKDLIPFLKELWESGEYEAVTRDGETDVKIYDLNFPCEKFSIHGRIAKETHDWDINGYYGSMGECGYDLMLRKKTKKVEWFPIFKNAGYPTKEACDKDNGWHSRYKGAIEVEI